jgi:hypothetical protein
MEIAQPEGIGGNKLRCNTTPIATTNNSDFGSVYNIINTIQNIVLRHSFSSLNFKCWSHNNREKSEFCNEWNSGTKNMKKKMEAKEKRKRMNIRKRKGSLRRRCHTQVS